MKLYSYQLNGLLQEGLQYYFQEKTPSYETIRSDLLARKPIQVILDRTSENLNEAEAADKAEACDSLLKKFYNKQISDDKNENTADELEQRRDERRAEAIPSERSQLGQEIQQNILSIQQYQSAISAVEVAQAVLLPQIASLSGQISAKNSELGRLRSQLSSTPRQKVISNENASLPPPPHTGSQHAVGSQQVVVSSGTLPPPPQRVANPDYGRLEREILAVESDIRGLELSLNALTRQSDQNQRNINQKISSIRSLEHKNSRLASDIAELNDELNATLPQKEENRGRRLAVRQKREGHREGIKKDIAKDEYDYNAIMLTLASANRRFFEKELNEQYRSLASTKKTLFTQLKGAIYHTFLEQLESYLPSLTLLPNEPEALRHIKNNLHKHFETEREVKEAGQVLRTSSGALADAKYTLKDQRTRLGLLTTANPQLALNIEAKRQENTQRQGLLDNYRASRKKWGWGSVALLSLTVAAAIPLMLYGAGALALTTVALGVVSGVTALLGGGSLFGLVKTLIFNHRANRELRAISDNDTDLSRMTSKLSQDEGSVNSLRDTLIPSSEAKVVRLEKEVESNNENVIRLERQTAQYYENAQAITPTSLSTPNSVRSVLPSAPSKQDVVFKHDEQPPAYTP